MGPISFPRRQGWTVRGPQRRDARHLLGMKSGDPPRGCLEMGYTPTMLLFFSENEWTWWLTNAGNSWYIVDILVIQLSTIWPSMHVDIYIYILVGGFKPWNFRHSISFLWDVIRKPLTSCPSFFKRVIAPPTRDDRTRIFSDGIDWIFWKA